MIGMTSRLDVSGATVLVTGASSGIGKSMAEEFARRGSNLVLVARSVDRLDEIAARIKADHGVEAEVFGADLTDDVERAALISAYTPRRIDILVNNAGIGLQGSVLALGPERQLGMVELNCVAVVDLTSAFLPQMVERRKGGVLNVASTAAFQPIPMMATYAATKAFVLFFSEALHQETRRAGVHVLALCPGPVATNFTSGFSEEHVVDRIFGHAATPDAIVAKAIDAFVNGRSTYLPGALSRVGSVASKLLPRRLVTGAAGRMFHASAK